MYRIWNVAVRIGTVRDTVAMFARRPERGVNGLGVVIHSRDTKPAQAKLKSEERLLKKRKAKTRTERERNEKGIQKRAMKEQKEKANTVKEKKQVRKEGGERKEEQGT